MCEDGDVESVDGVTYTVHGLVIGFKNGHAVFGLNKVSASGARKIVINGTFSGKTAPGTIRVTERRRSTSLNTGLGALDINGPAACSTGTDPFSIKH